MPIATADQLRRPPVLVTVPGTDLQIKCRRPTLLTLATKGWLQWPALKRVQELTAGERQLAEGIVDFDNRPQPTVRESADTYRSFLDELACEAAVAPRIVLTEAEAQADPGAVWVDDVPLDLKLAISAAVLAAETTAVAEFRGEQPPGAPGGPSGAPVRDAAVDPAGDQG